MKLRIVPAVFAAATALALFAPGAAAQTTVTGTFKLPDGRTPAQAGLQTITTISSVAMCGTVDFVPVDAGNNVAREMTWGGITFVPQNVRAWIRCDTAVLVRSDGTAGQPLIPTAGAQPAGLAYRANIFFTRSADGRLVATPVPQKKAVPDQASVDWASLPVAAASAAAFSYQLTNAATILDYEDWQAIVAPANPASGKARVWFDSSTLLLSCKRSDGTNCSPAGGGSLTVREVDGAPSIPTTSILEFNQAVGLTLADQGGGVGRVSLSGVPDSALTQITTAGKVSGAALTLLANIPSGAGVIPAANLPATISYLGSSIDLASEVNGTLSLANLPFGTANQLLKTNTGGTAVEQATLAVGTSGTDFAVAFGVGTITLNLPTASASNRGALASADWITFNAKESVLTFNSPLARATNTISCATCEVMGNKNAASGYAGLTSGTKLTKTQGDEIWGIADLTEYTGASGTGPTAIRSTITTPGATHYLGWSGSDWINRAIVAGDLPALASVNGSAAAAPSFDFDDVTPAAPTGGFAVKWQKDGSSPTNISAYTDWTARRWFFADFYASLQAALDACSTAGGGVVWATNGTTYGVGTSGVTVAPKCALFGTGSIDRTQLAVAGGAVLDGTTMPADGVERTILTVNAHGAAANLRLIARSDGLRTHVATKTGVLSYVADIVVGGGPIDIGLRYSGGLVERYYLDNGVARKPFLCVNITTAGLVRDSTFHANESEAGYGMRFDNCAEITVADVVIDEVAITTGKLLEFINGASRITLSRISLITPGSNASQQDISICATCNDIRILDSSVTVSAGVALTKFVDVSGDRNLIELYDRTSGGNVPTNFVVFNSGADDNVFLSRRARASSAVVSDSGSRNQWKYFDGTAADWFVREAGNQNFTAAVLTGGSPLVFEGATDDAFETTMVITDPTADRNFTIPNGNSAAVQPATAPANQFATAISALGVVSFAAITDADVPDTITASNYCLLTGCTFTGDVTFDNQKGAIFRELTGGGTNFVKVVGADALGADYTLKLAIQANCTGNTNGGALTINASNELVCSDDDGGAGGGGDNVSVNASGATDANFVTTAASGTEAGVTWSLNTTPSPDEIAITIGAASGTVAGTVTTGTQTLAGAKTLTSLLTLNPGTTPANALLLDIAAIGSAGTRDSHDLTFRGRSDDGSAHAVEWKVFADVTANAGASIWKLQSRIDAASFVDRLTLTDGGVLNVAGYQQGGAALNFSHLAGSATNAQVNDDITLTNITQITNRAITDLTGTLGDGQLSSNVPLKSAANIFTAAGGLTMDNQLALRLREATANGTNFAGFAAPAALTADYVFELPNSGFSAGFVKAGAISGGVSVWAVNTITEGDIPPEILRDSELAAITVTKTNLTLDPEGTGNAIGTVTLVEWQAATCQGTTATANFSTPAANAPAAECDVGTNVINAYLAFDAATDESVQGFLWLPGDWTGNIDVDVKWKAAAISNSTVWAIQLICVADGETSDPSFTTAPTVTDAAKGTANQENDAAISNVTVTGCAANERMAFRFFRDADNASDTMTGDARMISLRFKMRRTM